MSTIDNPITITDNPDERLREIFAQENPDRIVVVTDENVAAVVLPGLEALVSLPAEIITPGERGKTLDSAVKIWNALESAGASRKSMLVNVGGGMITDLGGFAAALFKRGIRCVNVSTSLLGAVDASIGGKTGVDFAGLKNEVGVFSWPVETIIATEALTSLPYSELLSGYGEILKTAYIQAPDMLPGLIPPDEFLSDRKAVARAIARCVDIKREVVASDPYDRGRRRILNFGHTAGHAFEELMLERGEPMPHGVAVAYGMLTALILSHIMVDMPSEYIGMLADVLKEYPVSLRISCDDYPRLFELMRSDKKNGGGSNLCFVLLREPGCPVETVEVEEKELATALDITRDYLGL